MNGNHTTSFRYSSGRGLQACETGAVNRAILFGDGIFETMVYMDDTIRFAKEHSERLADGLKLLKIIPSALTLQQLEDFLRQNFDQGKPLRIRWNVFRDGLGKYTPLSHQAQDLITVEAFNRPPQIKHAAYVSQSLVIQPSPWSHCKTLNGLPYIMANLEREELGMDEVLLLDPKGNVSEAGSANVFWVRNNQFYTPSLSCNCIAGIGRRKITESLAESGEVLIEGEFPQEELLNADQIFTSNATGISYLARLENRSYLTTPLPIVEKVFQ